MDLSVILVLYIVFSSFSTKIRFTVNFIHLSLIFEMLFEARLHILCVNLYYLANIIFFGLVNNIYSYTISEESKSKPLPNKGRSETGPCKSAEIQTLRQPLLTTGRCETRMNKNVRPADVWPAFSRCLLTSFLSCFVL